MIVAAVALRLALPVVGDPVAEPRLDVAVDAVVGDVELAAEVPLRVRQLPLARAREGLEPGHALAPSRLPELLEVALVDRRAARLACAANAGSAAGSAAPRRAASIVSIADRLTRLERVESYGKSRQRLAAVLGDEDEILEPDAAVAVAGRGRARA